MPTPDQLPWNVAIVEPLARSTGHQTWFADHLVKSLLDAGIRPTLITFDGMHDDFDLVIPGPACQTRRVSSLMPQWVMWLLGKATGIAPGTTAAPSKTTRFRMYAYNLLATAISTVYACLAAKREKYYILHLLCPPSRLVLWSIQMVPARVARTVITTFGAPDRYRGKSSLLRRLCHARRLTLVVQTEALAQAWLPEIGAEALRMIPLPSESVAGCLERREARRLLELPLGVPIIAVIGCIAPTKGYIELFDAIKDMPGDLHVLLIGDTGSWVSPDPAEIVRSRGWTDRTIIRRTFVPEGSMPALFSAIDAVALLYRNPNGSSGILSLCQRYGVPVLATKFGDIGARARAEDLGSTADPTDPEDVRRALREVLANSPNRDQSRSSRTAHEANGKTGYSWAAVAEAHSLLYAELASLDGK